MLGRAIAKYLAAEGAKVVILGRKAEVGEAIVSDIHAAGGEALFLTTDVLDAARVQQNCDEVMARYGRVDALLNAAGGNMPGATISPDGTFFDLDPAQFRTVLDLNLTGTVIPTQVFLRPMADAGLGAIVNFSSMAAFRPMTRVCGYAAAKAGISNFTAYMATECAKKFGEGIRVNAIAPGFFLTEQNRTLLTNPDGSYTQRGLDVIPSRRWASRFSTSSPGQRPTRPPISPAAISPTAPSSLFGQGNRKKSRITTTTS